MIIQAQAPHPLYFSYLHKVEFRIWKEYSISILSSQYLRIDEGKNNIIIYSLKKINMGKKFMLAIAILMAIFQVHAQGSYFDQDVCMKELKDNGCTEVFETIVVDNKTLSKQCPDMRVRFTLSKLICNGQVAAVHIWSSGASAPTGPGSAPCNLSIGGDIYSPEWVAFRQKMAIAIDEEYNNLLASLGASSLLVSTGSVCKAHVTFSMPAYTVKENVRTVCSTVWIPPSTGPWGSFPGYWQNVYCAGEGTPTLVVKPAANFAFDIPCKSELCCYGYASISGGKVVGVVPAPNPSGPGCPDPLTASDVQLWFTQNFGVQGGGASTMFNIAITPCQEECDLNRLVGRNMKSTGNVTANQKIDYNLSILAIKESSLTFKSEVMPSSYQILDINGRMLDNKEIQSNTIDIKSLSKGIYFLKANYDNGMSSVIKFAKD